MSCLSHCTSLFKDVIKLSKAEDITQGGIFNTLISFFDIAGGGYSCSSYTTAKPGCPPIPPGGGTSTPVAPVDPNDILGYVDKDVENSYKSRRPILNADGEIVDYETINTLKDVDIYENLYLSNKIGGKK